MSGTLDMGGHEITNVANSTNDQDAVTKKFTDNMLNQSKSYTDAGVECRMMNSDMVIAERE